MNNVIKYSITDSLISSVFSAVFLKILCGLCDKMY
jgi:hypothetical protein